MSCEWYFVCLDHDPPIVAESEFTQHTNDPHYVRALALARGEIAMPDVVPWGYLSANAVVFLRQHPNCALGIIDEYALSDVRTSTIPIRERREVPNDPR